MTDLSDELLYEGISVDIAFGSPGPTFGDLYLICGQEHPNFSPSGEYAFETLDDLQFSQVDDYFGVQSLADDGDDVIVWLYPLISEECVTHHPGPFDGIRLQFNVLRNPPRHADYFIRCVVAFAALSAQPSPDIEGIRTQINAVTEHWRANGVEVGSDDALMIE